MPENNNDQITESINLIRQTMSPSALFEQLAEECVELAHCALKQARIMRGENPSDADMVDLVKDTDEEVADVLLCLDVLGLSANSSLMQVKLMRWTSRVEQYHNAIHGGTPVMMPDIPEENVQEEVTPSEVIE